MSQQVCKGPGVGAYLAGWRDGREAGGEDVE